PRAVPPGSVAELSCQKIIFDLQLADLPVQKIDLGLIGGSLRRRAAVEDAHRTIQQLLLPVVDLVRVDPEMHRQLGDGPVALDCRQRHLRLESRAVLLPCPLHVLLPRYPRFLGAALHLIHLSHSRGPAQADTGTSTGRLMIAVLGGLADVERDLIRTRTAEGRSRAQKRGQHMGRPPKLTDAQKAEARRRRAEGATLSELARSYGVGKSTIFRLRP